MSSVFRHFLRKFLVSNYIKCIRPDHKINSIQNYIASETKDLYHNVDVNVYQENIFHTKMLIKDFDLDNYLFGVTKKELQQGEKKKIKQKLKKEMAEIFYGRNIPKV
ncbi:MAG: S-adenosylmethionine decarboxylase proenzyme precursor [Firmicutes bacterium ADurb.Bin419]|nr:MAG: S-adenosylmethionine decarboxylase proenzyme precursor [Firmicutes bacterium ADurb.Bin419]